MFPLSAQALNQRATSRASVVTSVYTTVWEYLLKAGESVHKSKIESLPKGTHIPERGALREDLSVRGSVDRECFLSSNPPHTHMGRDRQVLGARWPSRQLKWPASGSVREPASERKTSSSGLHINAHGHTHMYTCTHIEVDQLLIALMYQL